MDFLKLFNLFYLITFIFIPVYLSNFKFIQFQKVKQILYMQNNAFTKKHMHINSNYIHLMQRHLKTYDKLIITYKT